jgi:hypothetical protein
MNQISSIQLISRSKLHRCGSDILGAVICRITTEHEDTDRWFFGFIFETRLQTA